MGKKIEKKIETKFQSFFQSFCPFFHMTTAKTALKFNSALIFHSFPVVKKKDWKKD